MTKREKRYFILKKLQRRTFTLGVNLWVDLFNTGIAGTRVFLDEDNRVKVSRLTYDDCMDLLELERNGEPIPDNITIKTIED